MHEIKEIKLIDNAFIMPENNSVIELDLGSKRIFDTLLEEISPRLQNNCCLTALYLNNNHITAVGVKSLCLALKNNFVLQSLDLSNNKISDDGSKNIADFLKSSHSLETLDLGENQIGDIGAMEISLVLKSNNTLKTLNLSVNQIGAEGARELSLALRNNFALAKLNLFCNKIGDVGTKEFSSMLKENYTLTTLVLGMNQIGAEGAEALHAAMQNNHTLTGLHINTNNISKIYYERINFFLMRNEQEMLLRRQQFMYKTILLARDAEHFHLTSLWIKLPKDIRLYILKFLNFTAKSHIDKNNNQIYAFVKFVFDHIEECNVLIKNKQRIRFIEKRDNKGNYMFRFFKPSEESVDPEPLLLDHLQKKVRHK